MSPDWPKQLYTTNTTALNKYVYKVTIITLHFPVDTYSKYWKTAQFFHLLSFVFFHPRHNGQWPPTSKDFYIRSYPLHYFLILILEKEPVFPFSMLSAKQGNYWYHFYNVFGMTRSLTEDWTRTSRTRSQHYITRLLRRRSLAEDWTRDLPHSKPALYH